jgi:hypothetical protein
MSTPHVFLLSLFRQLLIQVAEEAGVEEGGRRRAEG